MCPVREITLGSTFEVPLVEDTCPSRKYNPETKAKITLILPINYDWSLQGIQADPMGKLRSWNGGEILGHGSFH